MKLKTTFLSCIFFLVIQSFCFANEQKAALNVEKIIGVKYAIPKITKNEKSVYVLNEAFYLVIEPPVPGDIEIYLNSSPIANKKALEKGALTYKAINHKFEKKIFFPEAGEGITLKNHVLMRVDLVISNESDKVSYTRFFETREYERDSSLTNSKYFIYLGSFESEKLAEKFQKLVEAFNGDVLALRDFKIVKEIKGSKEVHSLHLDGLSSLSVASSICSILMAREVSCLVQERKR